MGAFDGLIPFRAACGCTEEKPKGRITFENKPPVYYISWRPKPKPGCWGTGGSTGQYVETLEEANALYEKMKAEGCNPTRWFDAVEEEVKPKVSKRLAKILKDREAKDEDRRAEDELQTRARIFDYYFRTMEKEELINKMMELAKISSERDTENERLRAWCNLVGKNPPF